MKTGKQIEVFCFKKQDNDIFYLLLKRIPTRGDFWQPITGGNEEGESLIDTVLREIYEETGIKNSLRIIETGFSFKFNDNGRDHEEFCFGVEVDPNIEIVISEEHNEYRWLDKQSAMKLLVWENNKKSLEIISSMIQEEQ